MDKLGIFHGNLTSMCNKLHFIGLFEGNMFLVHKNWDNHIQHIQFGEVNRWIYDRKSSFIRIYHMTSRLGVK